MQSAPELGQNAPKDSGLPLLQDLISCLNSGQVMVHDRHRIVLRNITHPSGGLERAHTAPVAVSSIPSAGPSPVGFRARLVLPELGAPLYARARNPCRQENRRRELLAI